MKYALIVLSPNMWDTSVLEVSDDPAHLKSLVTLDFARNLFEHEEVNRVEWLPLGGDGECMCLLNLHEDCGFLIRSIGL